MQQYELHQPYLISVATLPCESENTENVTLQRDITKEIASDVSLLHQRGPRSSCAWNLLIWVLYSKACMKQRFMTSMTCKNAWCKLGLNLVGTSSMLAWPF